MTIWANEIKELDKLYLTFKGHIPDIVKEMEQLLRTDDANVVMLYSRRCLEVIVTDLCETELKRPRKTEPLKGIIDKLNSEEKVPSNIITSMHGLNSMATYGTHPKDFDPEQVKPVLNNLAIIIKWYLKYKDFQIVSKTEPLVEKKESRQQETFAPASPKQGRPRSKKRFMLPLAGFLIVAVAFIFIRDLIIDHERKDSEQKESEKYMLIDAYKTVKIGDQVWMAENLKTTRFNDGTPIPLVENYKEWDSLTSPAYCWYENDKDAYGDTYGPLYNWYAVNTGKLCPVGWHVPSEREWKILRYFLGDNSTFRMVGDSVIMIPQVSGMKLKEAGNAHWTYCEDVYSTDEYGFTALPGGSCNSAGFFRSIEVSGLWWSSPEEDENDARFMVMDYEYNGTRTLGMSDKGFGMSVRCIKD